MSSSAASDAAELRIICGPTAAGKSALALELAERHGATIISADSRQIYRCFDIGTAKPTRDEQSRVPHCGIDIADPTERWSADRNQCRRPVGQRALCGEDSDRRRHWFLSSRTHDAAV
jgi:hypothetical protein